MATIGSYPNDRPQLGLVEIINNLDTEQPATQNDVRELTHAFRWIGMEVKRPHFDLTADEMDVKLNQILKPDRNLKNYNMLILVIICHGRAGDELMSADKKVGSSVANIVAKLDDIEDMRGRPKILIFECCRGVKFNFGMDVPSHLKKATAISLKSFNRDLLPSGADVYLAFGTVPDYVAHTEAKGSPFILVLVEKLKTLAESCDLEKILTAVKSELSRENIHGKKQMPQTTSTLRKEVILKIGEKTYFQEGKNVDGIKYRKFGDRNGLGKTCWENQVEFRCGNFQDGIESFSGRRISEYPNGEVIEVDLHPGGKFGDWTGEGVMFNIRKKWKYEGQFKTCKKPGSEEVKFFRHGNGIYYFEDGSFYIGAFEYDDFKYGCKISKDGQVTECGIWKDYKLIKNLKK